MIDDIFELAKKDPVKNYVLTPPQMEMYIENKRNPDSVMYNCAICLPCKRGDLDLDRLIEAIQKAVDNHVAFRVRIDDSGKMPVMKEIKDFHLEIPMIETDDLIKEKKRLIRPFDLKNENLIRCYILLCEEDCEILFDMHHIIIDGTSFGNIVLKEIATLYEGGMIVPEKISQLDLSIAQKYLEQTEEYASAEQYYKEYLGDYEKPETMMEDFENHTSVINHPAGICEVSVKDDYNGISLKKWAKEHHLSAATMFLAAQQYSYARFAGTNRAMSFLATHGRYHKEIFDTVGMMVATVPMYIIFQEEETVEDFLRTVRTNLKDGMKNGIYPLLKIAEKHDISDSVLFGYEGKITQDWQIAGLSIPHLYLPWDTTSDKLGILVFEEKDGYRVRATYRADLYCEENIRAYLDTFEQILSEFINKTYIHEIEMTDQTQKKKMEMINETESAYDQSKTVIDLFREKAEEYPDNIAVIYHDKKITYKKLDELTDRLAEYIVSKRIGKEDVVSVLIPRNEYIVIASLGVLKSGAAYQPLDASYPKERLEFMIKDAGAKLLITDEELGNLITEYQVERLFISEIDRLETKDIALPAPSPEDLFILLYTSGTTGTPKGCMIEHHNIVHICHCYRKYFALTEKSRVTAYASYGFDANMLDLYPALTTGASVYIIGEDIRLDLLKLNEYFKEHKITHALMTTQVGRQFAIETDSEYLEHLLVGGEKLVPLYQNKPFRFWNAYGPTETTIFITAFSVEKEYLRVPIGKAICNTKLYVVDKYGKLLPPCVPGELWVAGHGVSRGYLNRLEQTEKVYTKNPFCEEEGYGTIYRTGDIVRMLPDGRIDFVGRKDGQVKVRGFRIELSEVEQIIREFPGIKDVTVAAFDEPGGGNYIAAYVVSDKTVPIEELNHFIEKNKPPYMVPAVTMQIDKIPLTQNHKVNKRALPKPGRTARELVLPETEMQQKICDCIKEIVGTDRISVTEDIFESGVTSIGAIKLTVILAKAFGKPVSFQDLKEYNTVRKLEEFFINTIEEEKYEILQDYPISQTQNGIFVECAANPNSTIYNIPYLMKLSDNIDVGRLKNAVKSMINAHPYIKTTLILNKSGDIRAKRNDQESPVVEIVECETLPDTSELVQPYKMLDSNLYRIKIFKTTEANYLFMEFHHIICDGTSMGIMIEDINKGYRNETIEPESYSGFEVALAEEKLRNTEAYEKAKAYYDSIFKDCDVEFLPLKDKNEQIPSVGRFEYISDLPMETIRKYCEEHNLTVNAFFTGVFGFVLAKYNYKEEALFTTIYNGRNDSRLANVVTMLVKTFPVRCDITGEEKIADFLKKIKEQLMESRSNDIYSFAEIARAYDIRADIMFAYQGDDFAFDSIGDEKAENIGLELDTAKASLSIDVGIKEEKPVFIWEYRADMYAESTIKGMAECMSAAAGNFVEKTWIKEVSILSETAEKEMQSFNATDYPVELKPVHKLFEAQVAKNPKNIACIADGEKITYEELNTRANKVAEALINKGIDIGEAVGMILPRTTDVPAAEYGIMKAGGAFLPMLPDYPDDRIDYCLKDAKSRFVVTTKKIKETRQKLFEEAPYIVLTIEEMKEDAETGIAGNPALEIPVDSLAYIIYTSGSTGTPKGVMIEHRNLCNFVNANPKNHETLNFAASGKTALSVAAISFDVSLMEMHIPLCNGMTVCIAGEEEIHNPLELFKLIGKNEINVITGTPSFVASFIELPQASEKLRNVKMYDIGAEAFPSALYQKIHEASPDAVIINGYGPTEATISCTSKVMDGSGTVTIGKPAANVQAYICDKYGNILPKGVKGELVICGKGVGRGYVGLAEKTAEVFVTLNGRKAYRSGDLARYNEDGEIEFFGRLDNQVKLRGFRIELDEIENVMNQYPGIHQSVILVKENPKVGQILCGYFTASETIDKEKLIQHLKQSLTYYMIPNVLTQMDAFPLTANGKINKKALPEPEFAERERNYNAPETELQKKLCEMFENVLGLEQVGVDEDFFEIGGTSLLASKIAMKAILEELPISYGDIFDHPTVKKLEEHVLKMQGKKGQSKEVKEKEPGMELEGISKALKYNTAAYVDEITYTDTGDVLLTGATGFLGIHVLNELIKHTQVKVYCLVRKGRLQHIESRLKSMMIYYFSDDSMDELFGKRIIPIEGDITDKVVVDSLEAYEFQTVINCAASVKHFVNDDSLEQINVEGVENLIALCSRTGRRLVQISTVSIAGYNINGKFSRDRKLYENELYFGQDLSNKYVNTKFRAEKAVLEAVASGKLDGKIIRVGNLMSRNSDGEFQANANTSGFMRILRAYAVIGKVPVSVLDEPVEFSPIDCTATAVICLAGTDKKFTVFQACNGHNVEMGDVIEMLNQCGIQIEIVKDGEFMKALNQALADEKKNMLVSGLISYASSDEEKSEEMIGYENSFTTKALYRLGFKWPIINEIYLQKSLEALATLGFFDM